MRKLLFYAWCIGGLIAFYFAIKFMIQSMTTDMALGFLVGVLFVTGLMYLNERVNKSRQRDGKLN